MYTTNQAVIIDDKSSIVIIQNPKVLFFLYNKNKKGVTINIWKSIAKYQPHPKQYPDDYKEWWSLKLSIKSILFIMPPLSHAFTPSATLEKIGPFPKIGINFQYINIAIT